MRVSSLARSGYARGIIAVPRPAAAKVIISVSWPNSKTRVRDSRADSNAMSSRLRSSGPLRELHERRAARRSGGRSCPEVGACRPAIPAQPGVG
jgi:hypothetical protein